MENIRTLLESWAALNVARLVWAMRNGRFHARVKRLRMFFRHNGSNDLAEHSQITHFWAIVSVGRRSTYLKKREREIVMITIECLGVSQCSELDYFDFNLCI